MDWFIRHPHGPRNVGIAALVQNHDLLPTVLDLLDLPGCEMLDGQSTWPLVTGARSELRPRTHWLGPVGFHPRYPLELCPEPGDQRRPAETVRPGQRSG